MECSELLGKIGGRIRFLRKEKKWSQERLSEMAGLHPTSLSDLEHGKVNGFICNYQNLANALGVSLADLVDYQTCVEEQESWREFQTLLAKAKALDEKRRAVFLDAAAKLIEKLESI
jgi:transcriptional regulator with XRE-family HTH domain